jgi:signal transduction histidine kinase
MSAFEPRRDAPERYTELTITLPVLPSLFDSAAIQNKYKQVLQENKLPHEFTLTKGTLTDFGGNNFRGQGRFNTGGTESARTFQFVGADFHFGNPARYIVSSMIGQLLFALLITGVLIVSFRFIYGSLKEQWQLSLLKNELISNITHELKTPVATVSVALDALQNFHALNDRERTKEYLAISAAEMKRLSMLIDKVLHFNMLEANKLELHPELVNLSEITKEAIQTLKPQAEKLQAALQLYLPPEEVWVQGDKLHLLSVLLNLLDNALKYRSQHPVINVTLEQDATYATWHVQDNGPGIAEEYKGRVFDKFFRVPTQDRHNVKGHGLGLSYVKDVVSKHGGTIQVQSQPGKGSIFTVRLPAWTQGA